MAKQWTKSEEFWLEVEKANAILALSQMHFEFDAVNATRAVLNNAKHLEKVVANYKRYNWEIGEIEKDDVNNMIRQLQYFKTTSERVYKEDPSKVEVVNNYNEALEIFREVLKFVTKKDVEV